jgi:hypothetical protein
MLIGIAGKGKKGLLIIPSAVMKTVVTMLTVVLRIHSKIHKNIQSHECLICKEDL